MKETWSLPSVAAKIALSATLATGCLGHHQGAKSAPEVKLEKVLGVTDLNAGSIQEDAAHEGKRAKTVFDICGNAREGLLRCIETNVEAQVKIAKGFYGVVMDPEKKIPQEYIENAEQESADSLESFQKATALDKVKTGFATEVHFNAQDENLIDSIDWVGVNITCTPPIHRKFFKQMLLTISQVTDILKADIKSKIGAPKATFLNPVLLHLSYDKKSKKPSEVFINIPTDVTQSHQLHDIAQFNPKEKSFECNDLSGGKKMRRLYVKYTDESLNVKQDFDLETGIELEEKVRIFPNGRNLYEDNHSKCRDTSEFFLDRGMGVFMSKTTTKAQAAVCNDFGPVVAIIGTNFRNVTTAERIRFDYSHDGHVMEISNNFISAYAASGLAYNGTITTLLTPTEQPFLTTSQSVVGGGGSSHMGTIFDYATVNKKGLSEEVFLDRLAENIHGPWHLAHLGLLFPDKRGKEEGFDTNEARRIKRLKKLDAVLPYGTFIKESVTPSQVDFSFMTQKLLERRGIQSQVIQVPPGSEDFFEMKKFHAANVWVVSRTDGKFDVLELRLNSFKRNGVSFNLEDTRGFVNTPAYNTALEAASAICKINSRCDLKTGESHVQGLTLDKDNVPQTVTVPFGKLVNVVKAR